MLHSLVLKSVEDAVSAVSQLSRPESLLFIEQAAEMISHCFQNGHKVLVAGNGGSLCDAAHFAEECTGVFRTLRPALPVIALTDPGHLTCVGNDLGYEWVFSRGVAAFGKPGDLFIGLTTSGNSANLVHAVEMAHSLEMKTLCFLGKSGGRLKGKGHLELHIEGFTTSDRIQEAHMAALHIIIELVEYHLFQEQ
jgi:D-sedoheptulose 7-phosphate isomerase